VRGKRNSDCHIDLGLSILSAIAVPGVSYTYDEIAAFCGCSWQAIQHIEEKALRKIRIRLREQKIKRVADLMNP